MLKGNIKIAIRNLIRRKSYTLLNIIGLSTGLACVMFIMNWVQDEMDYDRHFSQADNIYRVVSEAGAGTDRWHQAVTALPLGTTLLELFPEVETMMRIDVNNAMVENDNVRFIEDDILMVDPEFLSMFDAPLLLGSKTLALTNPYQIVLTVSSAKKYFGNDNPIGKTLKIFQYDPDGNGMDYEVVGVVADPIPTTHFTYNMLGSISTLEAARQGTLQNWDNNSYYTYIKLVSDSAPDALEEKFPQVLDYVSSTQNTNLNNRFYLQAITSIHLHSDLLYELGANGSTEYLWIFSIVGLFIILLAGINYINLSTSMALERSKEVGVRKVLGAFKSHLVRQHLMETLVLSLVSIILAGLLIETLKPFFHELTGKHHIVFNRFVLGGQLLLVAVPIGLVAGYIPAFFLARLQPLNALKGTIDKNSKSGLRSVLVTLQFSVTLVIVVGLVVVHQQLKYVQSQDLGYNKTNLLTLKVNGDENVKQGYSGFKNALLANSSIKNVATAGSIITSGLGNSNGRAIDSDGEQRVEKVNRLRVDSDYIKTYGMEIIAGRDFSERISSDTTREFIINERTAEIFGWSPEQAVGEDFSFSGLRGNIAGVVKDFHYSSLHNDIEPLCMYKRENFSRIIIRGTDSRELLSTVSQLWKQHFPSAIFDHRFQDEALADTYGNDARFGTIFNIFSGLSMLIAFLGLFGLVGYTVAKRAKEIGIRKVLGATSKQILYMLSVKFVRILLLASIIGVPFAWYMMEGWLSGFSYRIDVQAWHFIIASVALLGVALLIIFVQSMQSIMANPANTLKEE